MSARIMVWFGLLGAPLAWATQHVTGYALSEAGCHETTTGWDVPLDSWTLAVTLVAAALALAAWVTAILVWRATRGYGEVPGPGRVHFLATMGMALSPLFLAIILMGGLGSTFLTDCVQS